MTSTPVVAVGVDASPSSWQAVHLAAWESQQRQAILALVHGYPADPYTWYGWAPLYSGTAVNPQIAAQALADEVRDEVLEAYPGLQVESRLHIGTGSHALVRESEDVALVVVGARGQGGFAGLSIGSVAAQTAAHAKCPVLVVRPFDETQDPATATGSPGQSATRVLDTVHSGPVVLGVDGSPSSRPAIEFAFQEATFRRVPLRAVHVWWQVPGHAEGPALPPHGDSAQAEADAQRITGEMIAECSAKYPDVPTQLHAVQSMNPSYELIEASREASLVVVGSRGRGGFRGLLLGSVGRDLVGHAESPVAVVH